MTESADPGAALLELYPEALPRVYGYLLSRCGRQSVAEDLTAEAFLAAVDAVRRPGAGAVTTAWLFGVARHKLVDHWRRQAREERRLQVLISEPATDPWDVQLDGMRATATLADLTPDHRAVLTFRYIDDLSVREVADLMERSIHATEGLLSRAKEAFRRSYESKEVDDA